MVGERRAVSFLTSRGYQFIAQNVRVGGGELDIIVWDESVQELVFVEVKTRHQTFSGNPSLAVDLRKKRALRRACQAYVREVWRRPVSYRIDIIAIWPGTIKHYPNITWE